MWKSSSTWDMFTKDDKELYSYKYLWCSYSLFFMFLSCLILFVIIGNITVSAYQNLAFCVCNLCSQVRWCIYAPTDHPTLVGNWVWFNHFVLLYVLIIYKECDWQKLVMSGWSQSLFLSNILRPLILANLEWIASLW